MSDKKISGKRRKPMRYRPKGGMDTRKRKTEQAEAQLARSVAVGLKEPPGEAVFDQKRHAREISRAENEAFGLPPQKTDRQIFEEEKELATRPAAGTAVRDSGPYQPVPVADSVSRGIVGKIKQAGTQVIENLKRIVTKPTPSHWELVINSEFLEKRVALLHKGDLEDLHVERVDDDRMVGSIFKGRITNLDAGLSAAFVNIGAEKNAFLHYWDFVPSEFDSEIEVVDKKPSKGQDQDTTHEKIAKQYPIGSNIVVQITKGPIGTKGPRASTNLSIRGRYLVLLPNMSMRGVSKTIVQEEERKRLKRVAKELTLPPGMGVIVRTAGKDRKKRYFVRDLAILLQEWESIKTAIESKQAPHCVYREPGLVDRTVRDFLTEDIERIVVDTTSEYEWIRERIRQFSHRSVQKVKLYRESQPIFDRFGITSQIEHASCRRVDLKSGGYIVIDETEALVAIDVNTGRHRAADKDQEKTICDVNLEAAEEICRQLKLRNMGGLIVLDFVDMKHRSHQQKVYNQVLQCLNQDKARTCVLPISNLGLMEMTRQRHTESMKAVAYDDCDYCKGRGHVKSPLTMSVEVQRKIAEMLKSKKGSRTDHQLEIQVHPKIHQRLCGEDQASIVNLEKQYFCKLSFKSNDRLHIENFRVGDQEIGNQSETRRKRMPDNRRVRKAVARKSK